MVDKQNQGEPVALPTALVYVQEALSDQYAKGWNDLLDQVAKLGPLYTHADPGEVERLRAEIKELDEENSRFIVEIDATRESLNVALDKLAERDALLRDLEGKTILSWPDKRRISAALSASAEPSKPQLVECDSCPRSGGCVGTCMKAPASVEPSAPVERSALLSEIAWMRGEIDRRRKRGLACANKVATLRAKLAEAHALLKRVHQSDVLSHNCPLWKDIDAALECKP